jgi:hypothetical protein
LLNPKAPDRAALLKIKPKKLKELDDKFAEVRRRGVHHLALRACNVGKDPLVLSKFQQLFGAHSASAPQYYDAFGQIGPGKYVTAEATWKTWVSQHGEESVFGTKPNRAGVYGLPSGDHGFEIKHQWESLQAIKDWISNKLPSYEPAYKSGKFPYHGMWKNPGLIFPMDPEYVDLITYTDQPPEVYKADPFRFLD